MNNNRILTYGLSNRQNQVLIAAFGRENVWDVSGCFTDLLALPAAAAVVSPQGMSKDEMCAFNEVFKEDLDVCISLLCEMDEMRFMHIRERDTDGLTDTIDAIRKRLSILKEYADAMQCRQDTLQRVRAVIACDEQLPYRSQVAHITNACIPYGRLSQLLAYPSTLDPKSRYPYRVWLNSILMAAMAAHGIIDMNEIDGSDASTVGLEPDWIRSLAAELQRHYNMLCSKNGVVGSDR